jgi:hypothetical protein
VTTRQKLRSLGCWRNGLFVPEPRAGSLGRLNRQGSIVNVAKNGQNHATRSSSGRTESRARRCRSGPREPRASMAARARPCSNRKKGTAKCTTMSARGVSSTTAHRIVPKDTRDDLRQLSWGAVSFWLPCTLSEMR